MDFFFLNNYLNLNLYKSIYKCLMVDFYEFSFLINKNSGEVLLCLQLTLKFLSNIGEIQFDLSSEFVRVYGA